MIKALAVNINAFHVRYRGGWRLFHVPMQTFRRETDVQKLRSFQNVQF